MNYFLKASLIFFILFSCEKENTIKELYADVQFDDDNFKLVNNVGSISEGTPWNSNPENYSFGGSVYNPNIYIEGTFTKSIYSFAVIFHNIPFTEIKVGKYDFYHISDNDTIFQGVKIRWIDPESWEDLMNKYRLTENYANCIERAENDGLPSVKVCEEYTKGEGNYYLSSKISQDKSSFEITSIEKKVYEVWRSSCSPEYYDVEELIIEGRVNCFMQSNLDTANTISLSADFKLHIPDYLSRLHCN